MTCSQGSRTRFAARRRLVSSKRIARGLLLALLRFKNARSEYNAEESQSGTRRMGKPMADCNCMKPRSQPSGKIDLLFPIVRLFRWSCTSNPSGSILKRVSR